MLPIVRNIVRVKYNNRWLEVLASPKLLNIFQSPRWNLRLCIVWSAVRTQSRWLLFEKGARYNKCATMSCVCISWNSCPPSSPITFNCTKPLNCINQTLNISLIFFYWIIDTIIILSIISGCIITTTYYHVRTTKINKYNVS